MKKIISQLLIILAGVVLLSGKAYATELDNELIDQDGRQKEVVVTEYNDDELAAVEYNDEEIQFESGIVDVIVVGEGNYGGNITWRMVASPEDEVSNAYTNATLYLDGEGAIQGCGNSTDDYPWYNYKTTVSSDGIEKDVYLDRVVIGEGITEIGKYFWKSTKVELDKFVFPDSLTVLGEHSLDGCRTGESDIFVIPKNVKRIEGYCAYETSSISKLEINENLEYIGSNAFSGCKYLNQISFEENSKLKEIGSYAFYKCQIKELDIPDSLELIGNGAFASCVYLETIKFSDAVKKIGDSSFSGCTKLKELVLPTNIEEIGRYAFNKCSGIKGEIIIPDNCKKIGAYAFSECKGFTSLSLLGGELDSLGCFRDCDALQKIYIGKNVTIKGMSLGWDSYKLSYKSNQFYLSNSIYITNPRLTYVSVDSDNILFSENTSVKDMDGNKWEYSWETDHRKKETDIDIWGFNNGGQNTKVNGKNSYYISNDDYTKLTINLWNVQKEFALEKDWLKCSRKKRYDVDGSEEADEVINSIGSCYGMSTWVYLVNSKKYNVDKNILEGTSRLRDITKNNHMGMTNYTEQQLDIKKQIVSKISFYQNQQYLTSQQNLFYDQASLSSFEIIQRVWDKLNEVNVDYVRVGIECAKGKHAVLAYGTCDLSPEHEYAKKGYTHCILIYDPNDASKYLGINSKCNIYFNDDGKWEITGPIDVSVKDAYGLSNETDGDVFDTYTNGITDYAYEEADLNPIDYATGYCNYKDSIYYLGELGEKQLLSDIVVVEADDCKAEFEDSEGTNTIDSLFDKCISKVVKSHPFGASGEEESVILYFPKEADGYKFDLVGEGSLTFISDDIQVGVEASKQASVELNENGHIKAEMPEAANCSVYLSLNSIENSSFEKDLVVSVSDAGNIELNCSEEGTVVTSDRMDGITIETVNGDFETTVIAIDEDVNPHNILLTNENNKVVAKMDSNGDGDYDTIIGMEETDTDALLEQLKNDSESKIEYQSLLLNGSIGINYYINLPKKLVDVETAYIKINDKKYFLSDSKYTKDGYQFTYAINAKEMRDDLAVSLYFDDNNQLYLKNEDAINGVYYGSGEDYLELARQTGEEKTIKLADAMDIYGKWAQVYFDYNIDTIQQLEKKEEKNLSDFEAIYNGDVPEGLNYVGSSLILLSDTSIRHYYSVNDGYSIDDFEYYLDGQLVQPVIINGNIFYLEKNNIEAVNLGKKYKVKIVSQENEYSMAYGALSYMNIAKGYHDDTLKCLADAMYYYYEAAKDYWAVSGDGS